MQRLGTALARGPVLALATMMLASFYFFAFPAMSSLLELHTPAAAAFDTEFFYTPAAALHKAHLYGDADRAALHLVHWTYDLAFPLAYGLWLGSAWAMGLRLIATDRHEPRFALLFVPMAAVAFDLLENASVTLALNTVDSPGAAGRALATAASVTASAATPLKWVAVSISVVGAIGLLAGGIAASAIRRRRQRALSN